MSYLLTGTPIDDLLLMLAAHDGGTRPEPHQPTELWNEKTDRYFNFRPPIQARGMVFLNLPYPAMRARQEGLLYESPRNYRVMHLTWKGWDRVDDLLAAGRALPTEDELSEYARHAMRVVEGGIAEPEHPETAREMRRRMSFRCRHGKHAWEICSVDMNGHQSSRSRRCSRCFGRGVLVIDKQPRGYYGGERGPWEPERREIRDTEGEWVPLTAPLPDPSRSSTNDAQEGENHA